VLQFDLFVDLGAKTHCIGLTHAREVCAVVATPRPLRQNLRYYEDSCGEGGEITPTLWRARTLP